MGSHNIQPVIDPVNREILRSELNSDRFIRKTNKGSNEIFIINHHNAPNVMREIGRVREITFRAAGGGTGLDCDVDAYDLAPKPYEQLIVWDPDDQEIVGGYRFICCGITPLSDQGPTHLATSELF